MPRIRVQALLRRLRKKSRSSIRGAWSLRLHGHERRDEHVLQLAKMGNQLWHPLRRRFATLGITEADDVVADFGHMLSLASRTPSRSSSR